MTIIEGRIESKIRRRKPMTSFMKKSDGRYWDKEIRIGNLK